jgi:hypothetical protein
MKYRLVLALVIIAFVAAMAFPGGSVNAQAYTTAFTTSITYLNVGSGSATVSLNFYAENSGTAIPITRPALAKGAGTSLFVGSLAEISPGFKGSAVMSSDQPLVATLVQLPQGATNVKNRPLSNGFDAGSASVLVPTVLKNTFGQSSKFSVQNVDTVGADLTLNFYNATSPANPPIVVTVTNLPSNSARWFNMPDVPEITAASFNGSVVITSVKTGTSTPGAIVASAMELGIATRLASAFEGVQGGASTVYMPSAQCLAFGGTSSAYAVQNTSNTVAADVTVTYSNGSVEGPVNVPAGTKKSFLGCTVNSPNFSGSAVITATGAPIVAVGKISGLGLSTAFIGATSGGQFLAIPYIRWTETQWLTGGRQRGNIAIQNIGAAIPAGQVVVKYVDKTGAVVATETLGALATGAKLNSNPKTATPSQTEFGYYADATFGGGAIVEGPAGAQLVAIVRISSYVPAIPETVGEDSNAIVITSSPLP